MVNVYNGSLPSLSHYDVLLFVQHAQPFYYTSRASLIPGISDQHLSLALPIVAYWVSCLLFCFLDTLKSPWLARHRVHDPAEVTERNLVTVTEVVRSAITQQFIQIVLGLLTLSNDTGSSRVSLTDVRTLRALALRLLKALFGEGIAQHMRNMYEAQTVAFLYWWAIPAAQLLFAMCVCIY